MGKSSFVAAIVGVIAFLGASYSYAGDGCPGEQVKKQVGGGYVCSCPYDLQVYHPATQKCECPAGYSDAYDPGCHKLEVCKPGWGRDLHGSCACPSPKKVFANGSCGTPQCNAHASYDGTKCACDYGYFKNKNDVCASCGDHSAWNTSDKKCECVTGYAANSVGDCKKIECGSNGYYDPSSKRCACNVNYIRRNDSCVEGHCGHGHVDMSLNRCACDKQYKYSDNEQTCVERCPGVHDHFDDSKNKCVCDYGYYPSSTTGACVPNSSYGSGV